MELKEALKLALQSLWANKLRTVLTLIGVVIGVASVIAVVTLVNGATTLLRLSVAVTRRASAGFPNSVDAPQGERA